MDKTGERYAAARQALLRRQEGADLGPGLPTVPDYSFANGLETDHALLTSALAAAGVSDPATGEAFTETRLFGLSGGIGFMSFLFEYKGHPPMLTFVCRSFSMPEPVVTRAIEHAGIEHVRSETGSAAVARRFLDEALEHGSAVHATVDYASLPSSGMPEMWAGGMPRQANVVGRVGAGRVGTGPEGDDYVVDVGGPALLDAETLAKVRGAAKKEKHRAFTFEAGPASADPVAATRAAVSFTARNLVEAPYANFAANFGLAALEKQARLCTDTKDKRGWPRVFASGPLACLALYRTWECLTMELTAPAGGRALYAEFLEESTRLQGLEPLAEAAALARQSAEVFSRLADDVAAAAPEVAEAVAITEEIDELQRSAGESVGANSKEKVGETVRALRSKRTTVAERCAMDADARMASFTMVGEAFAKIHHVETELQRVLTGVGER